jgi:hypothetical protein
MECLFKSEHFLISVPIGTPFAEWIAGWPEGRRCGFPGRPNQMFEYRITFPVSAFLIVKH